jgi:aryl-alcohol dehydrogenase-like predicted oxidoreductase
MSASPLIEPVSVRLGSSDLWVRPLGTGAWSWGDRLVWGYGRDYRLPEIAGAFKASLAAGLTFFDTAEIYGFGASEKILGHVARPVREDVILATKFMPWPWRTDAKSFHSAVSNSLRRLGVDRIDLYQIHFHPALLSDSTLTRAIAREVRDGRIRAVGTSNYSIGQLVAMHRALEKLGVPLATHQAKYSLLMRGAETRGLTSVCRARNITLVAASPLAKGLLTGKYGVGRPPPGPRRLVAGTARLATVDRVVALMRDIGADHGGRTPSQVALNWLIAQRNVVPIPGAKNAGQAEQNAGALGWSLTPEAVAALDEATKPRSRPTGT